MSEKSRIRKKQIHLYITEEEFKILKDKADYAKTDNSGYIRKMIVDGKIVVDNSKIEFIQKMAELSNSLNSFEFQINKIGNNINQLVKVIHENNDLYSEEEIIKAKNLIENVGATFDELTKVMYEKLYDIK